MAVTLEGIVLTIFLLTYHCAGVKYDSYSDMKMHVYDKVWVFQDTMVTCKGQAGKECEPPELDLPKTQICDRVLPHTYGRGSCAHLKYLFEGCPLPDNPGGPLKKMVVLTFPQWNSFYHFLIDSMMRLYYIHKYYPNLLTDKDCFFHGGMGGSSANMWATMLGINNGNELIGGTWTAKEVYFPPLIEGTHQTFWRLPQNLLWAQEKMNVLRWARKQATGYLNLSKNGEEASAKDFSGTHHVLYVNRDMRGKGEGRRVINSDEVAAAIKNALPEWTFDMINDFPHIPPPDEMCRLFFGASIIVGIHGAGMANLICARKHAAFVEIRTENGGGKDFMMESLLLGLHHIEYNVPGSQHRGNMNVSMGAVKIAVEHAFGVFHEHKIDKLPQSLICTELSCQTNPPGDNNNVELFYQNRTNT
eukprot:m.16673 g.16673  ORF g.16673 m.16673 type:complete len:417 (+) comp5764_c0_seq2:241-1491(+)